jgi:hypothetical protein
MTTNRDEGALETLSLSTSKSVLFADIAAPPMNLLGRSSSAISFRSSSVRRPTTP